MMVSEPSRDKEFKSIQDRMPPQNVDAEEAILGGILMDPEAIGRITDILRPEAFYLSAHRQMYEAALALHVQGKPTDLMNVVTYLQDQDQLEKIGGQGKLADLFDRTPSAVNIDQYAMLVMEKYLRRRLIRTGQEISELGHDTSQDFENVLNDAEQKVFNITQTRPQDGLVSTADVLTQTFSDIESRSVGLSVPGLACGFYDLDAMTQGFQRSDLIIVAGRPAMGKTSFVLNIARNIASYHKLPVAVFSLEMSKEQLVQRLLSAEVRIESNRLRAGRITAQEWEPLGHSISTLSQMPIFIDDTPSISVPEMRSRLRRLQAEQGGALGLVLIDYLQLMESKNENRVQALSSITRGLKALARELAVPVIALSQLSRGVESRTEKRPMMSDLRECVTGDTLVMLADGRRVPIRELVGTQPDVLSMTPDEKITIAHSDKVWSVGVKPIFEVKLASGRVIKTTAKHRIYAAQGWQELQNLIVGSRVAIARRLPEMATANAWRDEELILLAHLMGDGSYLKGQPLRYTTGSEANSQIVTQAAETFGVTVNRHPGKGNWHQLVFSGNGNRWHPKAINLWLRNLGVFNQRSHEKHIPIGVFQQENHKVALFLAHLWATDGTYHTPKSKTGSRIHLATCSSQLAQDVAALLLRFEIVARIKMIPSEPHRPMYVVEISGKTMQMTFLDRVGAVACKVDDAARLRGYLAGIKANPNRDTIPQEIFSVIRFQMQEKGITTRQMATLRGTAYGGASHFKFAPSRDVVLDYAHLLQCKALTQKATSDLFWDEIVSITPIGEEEVFDLTVPGPASWLADGIVSHNSGAIEQDADLIMMLYRDEYYNPDTPDRGIAEVIISKHRNGPVGSVKLLFEPQFTQFRNLAASNRDY
jgi:replicative DNA helicase